MSLRHTPARLTGTPAASSREQRARSSPPSSPRQSIRSLPKYIPPSAPLNAAAITALENSNSNSDHVSNLKKAQNQALVNLSEASVALYDAALLRREFYERACERLETLEKKLVEIENRTDDDSAKVIERRALQERLHAQRTRTKERKDGAHALKQSADDAYQKLEPKLRSVIDGKVQVEGFESILSEVSGNVQRGEGRIIPTQSTLGTSQFRSTQHNFSGGEAEDGDSQHNERHEGVLEAIKAKNEQRQTAYDRMSMRQRYVNDKHYVEFKTVVHDAIHADDGVLLAHPATWFPAESGEDDMDTGPASNMPGAFTQVEDPDSDLEIAGQRMSTRCPLSLVEMKDPATAPCNHTFECSAIVDFIKQSSLYIGGTQERRGRRTVNIGGEQAVRCPEASCSEQITERSLRRDAAVRRKIKRLQDEATRRERHDEGFDGDGPERHHRAVSLETDGPESRRQSMLPSAAKVKKEYKLSTSTPSKVSNVRVSSTPGDQSMVELDDDTDEDCEE